jgi:hypothetical protein
MQQVEHVLLDGIEEPQAPPVTYLTQRRNIFRSLLSELIREPGMARNVSMKA